MLRVIILTTSILSIIGNECDAKPSDNVEYVKKGGMYFNTTFLSSHTYALTGNVKISKDVVCILCSRHKVLLDIFPLHLKSLYFLLQMSIYSSKHALIHFAAT